MTEFNPSQYKLDASPVEQARKALTAFLVAGVGSAATALVDGSVTVPELLAALGVGLLGAVSVYKVENA